MVTGERNLMYQWARSSLAFEEEDDDDYYYYCLLQFSTTAWWHILSFSSPQDSVPPYTHFTEYYKKYKNSKALLLHHFDGDWRNWRTPESKLANQKPEFPRVRSPLHVSDPVSISPTVDVSKVLPRYSHTEEPGVGRKDEWERNSITS
jgi:hypothetical protein